MTQNTSLVPSAQSPAWNTTTQTESRSSSSSSSSSASFGTLRHPVIGSLYNFFSSIFSRISWPLCPSISPPTLEYMHIDESPTTERRETKETKTPSSREIEKVSRSPLLARHVFECLPPALIPPIRIIICDYIPEIFAWRAAAEDPEIRPLFPQEIHTHFQRERSATLAELWKKELQRMPPQEISEEHALPKTQEICTKLSTPFLLSWCDSLRTSFHCTQPFPAFPYSCSKERIAVADLLEEIINSGTLLRVFLNDNASEKQREIDLIQFCCHSVIPQLAHVRLLNTLVRYHSHECPSFFMSAVKESIQCNAPDSLIIHLLQLAPNSRNEDCFHDGLIFIDALRYRRSYIIEWLLQNSCAFQKANQFPFLIPIVRAARENHVEWSLPPLDEEKTFEIHLGITLTLRLAAYYGHVEFLTSVAQEILAGLQSTQGARRSVISCFIQYYVEANPHNLIGSLYDSFQDSYSIAACQRHFTLARKISAMHQEIHTVFHQICPDNPHLKRTPSRGWKALAWELDNSTHTLPELILSDDISHRDILEWLLAEDSHELDSTEKAKILGKIGEILTSFGKNPETHENFQLVKVASQQS